MQLDGLNDQLMSLAAFRYCLGRRSYIVGSCLEWLRDTWEQFEPNTKSVMVRDTIEALMDDNAGHSCDVREWLEFAKFRIGQLTLDQQTWIRQQVSHKNKPFPW
jgi:hypothetical protein